MMTMWRRRNKSNIWRNQTNKEHIGRETQIQDDILEQERSDLGQPTEKYDETGNGESG